MKDYDDPSVFNGNGFYALSTDTILTKTTSTVVVYKDECYKKFLIVNRHISIADLALGKKFTKEGLLHTWEAFPLFFVVGGFLTGAMAFFTWQFNTRDIQVNRRRKPINERIDLLNPYALKLLVIEHGPQPVPELHAIYKQMEEEKKHRVEEMENLRRQGKKRARKQE